MFIDQTSPGTGARIAGPSAETAGVRSVGDMARGRSATVGGAIGPRASSSVARAIDRLTPV